ncbi:MAG TPA: hypothetical protein VGJ21_12305 [Terracidiphilus sp.]|jgi:hypothetical protein
MGLRAFNNATPGKRMECDDKTRLETLRDALEAGEASGIADSDVIAEVRESIGRQAELSGNS